jgi:hypothetical protein
VQFSDGHGACLCFVFIYFGATTWKCDNVEARPRGSTAMRKRYRVKVRQCGSATTWKRDHVEVRQCGSATLWKPLLLANRRHVRTSFHAPRYQNPLSTWRRVNHDASKRNNSCMRCTISSGSELTPSSRGLLETLAVTQLRNFASFIEPESSVPCSQDPATGHHPEAVEYIPHCHTLFL